MYSIWCSFALGGHLSMIYIMCNITKFLLHCWILNQDHKPNAGQTNVSAVKLLPFVQPLSICNELSNLDAQGCGHYESHYMLLLQSKSDDNLSCNV